ncbi:radical SAM family heme chaperone HemW [Sphingobacterium faecium]|uniref:radical SAM family heme chaperone HemW n=1 Tax=Sphingobacterium faecium TaxID=34087 RepID=UPI0032082131
MLKNEVFGGQAPETREEFYTNYPLYRYWSVNKSDDLFSSTPINIYIHIPFCVQICEFCYYRTEKIKSQNDIDNYIESLCKEIALVGSRKNYSNTPVNSIYIGGGTPSLLKPKQFQKIVDTLRKFHDISSAEFTLETAAGTFNKEKIESYLENGVNRISMGVQSFDDKVLRMSNRTHVQKLVFNSIELLQDYNGLVVNIDILSGLVGDTYKSFSHTVEEAIKSKVDAITFYKFKTYANTAFYQKSLRNDKIELPTEQQEIEFMEFALESLKASEYDMWTTFAFTRNGYKHTYIEKTWRGDDCIAYGVSSFGSLSGMSYQNTNDLTNYTDCINKNVLPLYRQHKLSLKDMIVKELLLCVARLKSYEKTEFVNKFGFDYCEFLSKEMEYLCANGFIHNTNDLELTTKGILFGDYIGKVLAEGFKEKVGRDKYQLLY